MEEFKNENLDFLEREEAELMQKLAVNRQGQRDIKVNAFLHERNLKTGDAVMYSEISYKGRNVKEGKLVSFAFTGTNFNAVIQLFNVDGNLGKLKKTLTSEEMKTIIKI